MRAIPSEFFKERVTTMDLNREELRSAIIGMVLGDGSITKRSGRKEAYFQMTHCEQQYEYLLWKQKILNKITSSIIHPTKKILNGKEFKGFHLGTPQHPFFTKLYNRMYYKKSKVVDEYIVKKINPLALAIFFMDDGTQGRAKDRPKTEKSSYFLCSNDYDYANQLLLKKSLKINFDLDWNLNKSGKNKDGTYQYRLRLARRHNENFEKIVSPYILPCMSYKLDPNADQSIIGCDIV